MVVYRADWPENSELIERLIDPFKMANVMLAVAVRGENGESIPRNQWTDFEIEAPIDGPPGRRLRQGLFAWTQWRFTRRDHACGRRQEIMGSHTGDGEIRSRLHLAKQSDSRAPGCTFGAG